MLGTFGFLEQARFVRFEYHFIDTDGLLMVYRSDSSLPSACFCDWKRRLAFNLPFGLHIHFHTSPLVSFRPFPVCFTCFFLCCLILSQPPYFQTHVPRVAVGVWVPEAWKARRFFLLSQRMGFICCIASRDSVSVHILNEDATILMYKLRLTLTHPYQRDSLFLWGQCWRDGQRARDGQGAGERGSVTPVKGNPHRPQ